MKTLKLVVGFISLAVFPIASNGLELGTQAVDCQLQSFSESTPIKIFQPGKVVYLDFWASWCGPCAQSIPFMNAMQEKLKAKGLEVIGINLDEQREDAVTFISKHPVKFTLAVNSDNTCPQSYGVEAMPFSFIIDKQGKIRHIQKGFHKEEAADIESKIQALLTEK